MKRLDKCVNIIPVIAKSDTLTLEEREAFKRRVSVLHNTHKLSRSENLATNLLYSYNCELQRPFWRSKFQKFSGSKLVSTKT